MTESAFADNAHAFLVRLFEILTPGHNQVVVMVEAYFDESGSHDGSPALCVAGYIYWPDECLKLDLGWKVVLEKYDLPYFHMVDCAHGAPPFDKLSKGARIECEKEIIPAFKEIDRLWPNRVVRLR